ncbi:phospholipase D-like domain-containing protein [Aquitalea magnusonii]|uniref:phospholipase D-like domain-containing protein n=1 Tax=Aquitalea magnusonii TaxID=332411 RepID=UPI001E35ABF1|nr:phospholipase D-like domain-containing protein [Aquitalea magnusonii]
MHVCTLVAPDSPPRVAVGVQASPSGQTYPAAKVTKTPGRDWTPVYVHAKLMIVNDTFMTLGSANINTRSMQVDSELNIAHHRPEITVPLRRQLWNMHTKGMGAQDRPDEAFKMWGKIIVNNKNARADLHTPIASLIEFSRQSATRTNKD